MCKVLINIPYLAGNSKVADVSVIFREQCVVLDYQTKPNEQLKLRTYVILFDESGPLEEGPKI